MYKIAPWMAKKSGWLLACFIGLCLFGCNAGRSPFSLAPSCPVDSWTSCEKPCPPAFTIPPSCCPQPVLPDLSQLLSLPQLVDVALQNSNQTQQTWASARAAAAQYGQSLSGLYPALTATGTYERQKVPEVGISNVTNELYSSYGPQLSVSLLLFDFGTTLAGAESFKQALFASNWTHNREIQTVVQTILTDYGNYLNSKGQVEANEANLHDARVNLEATVVKRRNGINDLTDELNAKSQVSQNVLSLLNAQQTMVTDVAQMASDAGLPANFRLDVQSLPQDLSYDDVATSIDLLIAQAVQQRPDLASAQAQILSNQAALKQARRSRYPTLNFTGDVGKTYFGSLGSDDSDFAATLTLSVPLFKGYYYYTGIKQAQANLEYAQASYLQLQNTVTLQVVQAYQDLQLASQMVKAAKDYVDDSQQAYDATLQKYQAGTVDFTTLVSSLTTLADSRSSLVTAKSSWFNSLINLSYATGSLGPDQLPQLKTTMAKEQRR